MSKRLSNLVERDGAFHNVCFGGVGRPEEMIHQTYKNGSKVGFNERIGGNLTINFTPELGYYFSEETRSKEEITDLDNKIISLEQNRFNLSAKELEQTCKDVKDINKKVHIESFKDKDKIGFRKDIGEDAILGCLYNTLYLLRDGNIFYTGNKRSLPKIKSANLAPLKHKHKIYSEEFYNYLKKKDIEIKMTFGKGKGLLPKFKLYNNSKIKTNENYLLKILTEKEFKPFWEIRKTNYFENKYNGKHFFIEDSAPRDTIYKNATNFNRVYTSGKEGNINIEIPKNYKYDLDRKENEGKIWGEVKKRLNSESPSLARLHIFKSVEFDREDWEYGDDGRVADKVLIALKETAATPNIETRFGDIRILSHSPNVKIIGADKVYGKPPEDFKQKINCYSEYGKTEVVYDF